MLPSHEAKDDLLLAGLHFGQEKHVGVVALTRAQAEIAATPEPINADTPIEERRPGAVSLRRIRFGEPRPILWLQIQPPVTPRT
jgi:hypothetical protein